MSIDVKRGEMASWEIWEATDRLNKAIIFASGCGFKVTVETYHLQEMGQKYPTPTIETSVYVEMTRREGVENVHDLQVSHQDR